MLLVGGDDGVYRTTATGESAERTLSAGRALRVRTFDGIPGAFAATETGLYHTADGEAWTALEVPREQVYAVGASSDGDRVFAGTRPAHVYAAPAADPEAGLAWRELEGFRAVPSSDDWGLPRHDDTAQVRDVRASPTDPDRLVAGVEVGGVFVSDDGGETWTDRRIEGFDAPHTDDVHHVAVPGNGTVVAATGSGLYRTTDAGRTWARLDDGTRPYFRESHVRDGVVLAGGSPAPPSTWTEDRDHALYESRDGRSLDAVESPAPTEVAVGWCDADGTLLAATNRGTLCRREAGEWAAVGSVPVAESVDGRCVPLAWLAA